MSEQDELKEEVERECWGIWPRETKLILLIIKILMSIRDDIKAIRKEQSK